MRTALAHPAVWRVVVWLVVVLVLGSFLYYFRSILPPFLIGLLIAHLLDPVLDGLQKRGYSRTGAIALVYLLFFLLFLLVVLLVGPALVNQIATFSQHFDDYVQDLTKTLERWGSSLRERLDAIQLPPVLADLKDGVERLKLLLPGGHQGPASAEPGLPHAEESGAPSAVNGVGELGQTPQTEGYGVPLPSGQSPSAGTSPSPPESGEALAGNASDLIEGAAPEVGAQDTTQQTFAAAAEQTETTERFDRGEPQTAPPAVSDFQQLPKEQLQRIARWLVEKVQRFSANLLLLLSRSLWVFILPIVAYYFLRDYDVMRWYCAALLPEEWQTKARSIAGDLGKVLGGYIRAQAMLCLSMGVMATLGLMVLHFLTGMQYVLFLGVITGVFSLIPYVGIPSAAVLSGGVAFWTGGHSWWVALGATCYILSLNVLSDYLIAPRLMSANVGLHPLVVLFALMAAGKVGGVVGMVLAAPVAASIKVLLLHFYPRAQKAAASARERLDEDIALKQAARRKSGRGRRRRSSEEIAAKQGDSTSIPAAPALAEDAEEPGSPE